MINQKTTLFMAPDGSKKGWAESIRMEGIRRKLKHFLLSFNYDDGSNPWDWVEVGYGEFGQKVLDGNCTNRYSNDPYY